MITFLAIAGCLYGIGAGVGITMLQNVDRKSELGEYLTIAVTSWFGVVLLYIWIKEDERAEEMSREVNSRRYIDRV